MTTLIFKMASFGQYLASKRAEKGWSQRELGRKANMSFATIQKLEGGEIASPGLETVLSLARALQVPIAHFLLAYQGKDPEAHAASPDFTPDKVEAFIRFFKTASPEDRDAIMKKLWG